MSTTTDQQLVFEKFGYEFTFARDRSGDTLFFCVQDATDAGTDYGCHTNFTTNVFLYFVRIRIVLELLYMAYLYRRWKNILENKKCGFCKRDLKDVGIWKIARYYSCDHWGCEQCVRDWYHKLHAFVAKRGKTLDGSIICRVCVKNSHSHSTKIPMTTPLGEIYEWIPSLLCQDFCLGCIFVFFSVSPLCFMESLTFYQEANQGRRLQALSWEAYVANVKIYFHIIYRKGYKLLFTHSITTQILYTLVLGKLIIFAQQGIFEKHPKLKFLDSSKVLAKICLSLVIIKWVFLMYNLGSDAADRISKYGGHIH